MAENYENWRPSPQHVQESYVVLQRKSLPTQGFAHQFLLKQSSTCCNWQQAVHSLVYVRVTTKTWHVLGIRNKHSSISYKSSGRMISVLTLSISTCAIYRSMILRFAWKLYDIYVWHFSLLINVLVDRDRVVYSFPFR